MKRVLISLLLCAACDLASRSAEAKIRVVATVPDLAEFASRIGGDLVQVDTLASGVEDIHAVPMKPSFAVLLNKADMVVLLGLEVEHAFLPGLLDAARNPKVQRDAEGYVDCSKYVRVLDVPERLDRALGDQHPMGNPHYNLDPVAMKEAARAIEEAFARSDPEHGDVFRKNLDTLLADLDANIARWTSEAAPLKGRKVVSYHPDLIYFADRFGMEPAGTIEIRAGIDPTPAHVEGLIDRMRREKVDFVVRERHYPAGLADTVAQRTGAKLVELPVMVRGVPEAATYVQLIDYNLHALLAALQRPGTSTGWSGGPMNLSLERVESAPSVWLVGRRT